MNLLAMVKEPVSIARQLAAALEATEVPRRSPKTAVRPTLSPYSNETIGFGGTLFDTPTLYPRRIGEDKWLVWVQGPGGELPGIQVRMRLHERPAATALRVTAVGDCGVDRYLNLGTDRPGGITLNFAANARRLFAPDDAVGVVTAVGTDDEAGLVRRAIARCGLEATIATLEGATSLQLIDRRPSGEKIFVRYAEGVLGRYCMGQEERAVIARSDLLMAVVYSQIEELFDSVMEAPSPGLRAVDFGDLDGLTGGLDLVERYLDRIHVAFFGLISAQGDLIASLEGLARSSGRLFIVTLGADGSLAFAGSTRLECRAVAVPHVVDTTGAGDTFAAGFLSEYCRSGRVPESLALGAQCAAETVQRLGAFPWDG